MDFIYAFLVGGAICLVGQVLLDFAKLTPAHLMATFVVIAVLDGFGLYDKLIKFAGAGAMVPVQVLDIPYYTGQCMRQRNYGYIGIGMGMFNV
ncbi:SpoVA/SpoVAEb family sporulation membrane protein [Bacillus pacificus]